MEEKLIPVKESLAIKLREAMNVLGIPEDQRGEPLQVREDFREVGWINQGYIFGSIIEPMWKIGIKIQRGHSEAVAFEGMGVSKLLNFEKDARVLKFIADLYHDKAKIDSMAYYPKRGMTKYEKDMALEIFKRNHVSAENICTEFGTLVASIIEQSHTHQKKYSDPYPDNLNIPRTSESFTLSQLLAIQDFYNSASSRPCKITHRQQSLEQARELLLNEYGDMKIKYDGPLLPKMDIIGGDLISTLYSHNIFGQKRPQGIPEAYFKINPFVGTKIE